MIVYWEYAFLENCVIDGMLLSLSVKSARGKISVWRIVLASLVGGSEALIFPLLRMPIWCCYLVKFLGGVLIALIAVKGKNRKHCMITVASFFLFTFVLGGILTAVYSFFGVDYVEGRGYLVERIPITLLLCSSGLFAVGAFHAIKKMQKAKLIQRHRYACRLQNGNHSIRCDCFADSGNFLLFHGKPVCVISAVAALALFPDAKAVGRMAITTVNGKKESLVFQADRLVIECDGKAVEKHNVLLTVGEIKIDRCPVLLHTSYLEDLYENIVGVKMLAAKDSRQ